MPLQHGFERPGGGVPNSGSAVVTARDEKFSIGREGHIFHVFRVKAVLTGFQMGNEPAGFNVPDFEIRGGGSKSYPVAAAREKLAIARKGQGSNCPSRSFKPPDFISRLHIP